MNIKHRVNLLTFCGLIFSAPIHAAEEASALQWLGEPDLLRWIALFILSFAAIQGVLWAFRYYTRNRYLHRQHALELNGFAYQAQAAKLQYEKQRSELLHWEGYRTFELMRIEPENINDDIRSFYLAPHDQKPIPSFQPGQYLTFELNPGNNTNPVVRCYSLSDCPETPQKTYRITVKRLPSPPNSPGTPPGIASNFLHQLQPGAYLKVRAPAGRFVIDPTARTPVVLIAGGVGITPVLSMLNAIIDARTQRDIWFFYSVRHGGETVMGEYLRGLEKDHPRLRVHISYDSPNEVDQLGTDYHHHGRIDMELLKKVLPNNEYEFYLCGPPPMMKALIQGLTDWDVALDKIFYEQFASQSSAKRVSKQTTTENVNAADVSFGTTTVSWSDSEQSLLSLAEANGIKRIPFACRVGSCGTCCTAVRSGVVEYPWGAPDFDVPDGSCLPCSCVPKGAVVLDV